MLMMGRVLDLEKDRHTVARMKSLILVLLSLTATSVAADPDPLFRSDEIVDIKLTAPFGDIMKSRSVEEETEGQLEYVNEAGETVTLDVKLRARGNFRRDRKVCTFTPLRLNFAKKSVKDTLFHKQDKLKLVTHCKPRDWTYQQGVIREYLAYRIFNEITDMSFRVRLLQVTYVDPDSTRQPVVSYGFFIEHKDRLAKRVNLEPTEGIGKIRSSQLDMDHTALSSVFHYLIGNTDFSPISSEEKTACCHNHTLFNAPDDKYVSIPYDFDMSGFVDAEYARPNSRFKIRKVTQRLYRGRCRHNSQMEATLATYRDRRDTIYGLLNDQQQLHKATRKRLVRYVDDFYKTINDPKRLQSRMINVCL